MGHLSRLDPSEYFLWTARAKQRSEQCRAARAVAREKCHFRGKTGNAKPRFSHFGENVAPEGPGFGLGERRVGRLGETFRVKTRSRARSTLVFHQRTQRDPQSSPEGVVVAKFHFACTRGPLPHAHPAWQSWAQIIHGIGSALPCWMGVCQRSPSARKVELRSNHPLRPVLRVSLCSLVEN